ncbi:hypothetical protein TanjilG_19071 [Lupinus angustifolius]|uniref:Bromo domain-containing protein n=1 Tax=Lupinus angustifolius TaxID=3871 RepID=A0A4P1RRH5_LUPAN|nr:PREDICTED: uncharacterized protein LOC109342069 [Lupinus angustifolius]XP_019435602.1 PREDICTED: uncharacterized protein LOC109342069 [Lupinus angustifolius]OIW16355.1 hypothetical protein TanjilG_19071 [Lupinus angustifolius]
MGQIVRRKKKGRPSKADLAHRSSQSPSSAHSDVRRSRRRRNMRYSNMIDYDDYLDEEEEDEDERRREKKKLKLVTKLNHDHDDDNNNNNSNEEEEEEVVERKKYEEMKEEEEEEEDELEEEGNEIEVEENEDQQQQEDKGRKVDSKGLHSVLGTPPKLLLPSGSGIPLPDKRTLELILDKLQKKDTYGVYAEPVDPEELPDYHDVIDHPMDFATVRKKLENGSYPTLEQFESDIFLICSNAMRYNALETIYHKQAQSIQELARKKFEKLRIDFGHSHSDLKSSDKKIRCNSLVKKLAKKPLGASQEPVGSDFSSGATLATIGDVQPTSHPLQGVIYERRGNADVLAEGNAFFIEANQEKAEDILSGKGTLSKLGRKSSLQDYEPRATYNMSNQPITRSDSIFMTFESEIKQLVTVGLQAEHSYARSLARFAATLGPTAWKIASEKIQQALPPGCKFGRGWVGEYEPLPTPVFMFNNRVHFKEPSFVKMQSTTESIKVDKNCKNVEPTIQQPANGQMFEVEKPSVHPGSGPTSEGKPSLLGSVAVRPNTPANLPYQQPNVQTRNPGKSVNKGLKQMELNSLPPSDQNNASLVAKLTSNAPAAVSKPRETIPSNTNISPPMPFKQSDTNGIVSGNLPNGKVRNDSMNRRMPALSESTSNQTGRAAPFIAHGPPSPQSTSNQTGRAIPFFAHGQPSRESVLNQTGRAAPFVSHGQPSPKSTPHQKGRATPFVSHEQPSSESILNQTGRAAPSVSHGQPSLESTSNQTGRASPFVFHGQPSPESISNQTGRAAPVFAHGRPSPESTSNQKGRASPFVSHGQPSPESTLNQTGRAGPFVAHGQEQNLSDPVQLMRMLAEKSQKQQQTSGSPNHSPVDIPPLTPSVPSGRRDGTGNASGSAARAWMSVGAGGIKQGPDSPRSSSPKNQISADSLYNPAREFHQHMSQIRGEFPSSRMSFQSEKNNFPFHALAHQPLHPVGVSQFQNRPMIFPQVAAPSDLSRFQMQPPWQGIRPHSQPKQKQGTLPPDLNIGFQSPGSPAKQSSGVMVDSQQPDLALQL